jgi:hypothetical protein
VNTAGRPSCQTTRVAVDPTMSSVLMSIVEGSSSPSAVMVSCSSARPTLRPTTTGVAGDRCRSTRSRTALTCQVRVRDAGLYSARTRSAAAALSIRPAMTSQGLSRSDRLMTQ